MKSFRKFIRTDVARHVSTLMVAAMFFFPSCTDYLDVVPDNVVTLEDVFSRKTEAWNALAKIYSYMPKDDRANSSWFLGNEYMVSYPNATGDRNITAPLIMMGQQSANDPFLPSWSAVKPPRTEWFGPVKPLYEGIRMCNIFLQHIDGIGDMTDPEKADWAAQATFLKAYYHFVLLQKYGPIVIADKVVSPDAIDDELFQRRSKVEECFKYIIRVMDEAIPNLNTRASSDALGQVDKLVARSIKARVLLFRASPFYNGNTLFSTFKDPVDGQPFFPLVEDKEKWKDAIDAIDEAIEICLANGVDLYTYNGKTYEWDAPNFAANPDTMKRYYDVRMLLVDPWNKELIWGYSNVGGDNSNLNSEGSLACAAQIRLWNAYNSSGGTFSQLFAWNWLCATYNVAERYYTKNGLPLDEDVDVDMSTILQLTTTPGPTSNPAGYAATQGILRPDFETVRFHLNREPRFYANLGISGGYWRSHVNPIALSVYAGTDGGINQGGRGNPSGGSDQFWATGMGVQKLVHPESKAGHWAFVVQAPIPIIRLADLYLMQAEALNEYGGPSQPVYNALNKVRRRAGIPDVEVVWASSQTRHPNKHQNKDDLRDIILRERSIELAFEGIHYWDMLRHKRSEAVFNTPITGWTITANNARDFFVLNQVQPRRFTTRDYLWPIDLNELNTNNRLVQNPGW
ncbi:RagB/SusD domain-containing protein [Candidatus Symbiothrix dinenymphae]|nr:RagB/SusD domain-containing protein [Candidatus Symbiothrix dinenymphae]